MSAMKQAVKERRCARFFVGLEVIEEYPERLLEVLREVLITRAEFEFTRNGILYDGYSLKFEPVPENQVPPTLNVRRVGNFIEPGSFLEFSGER